MIRSTFVRPLRLSIEVSRYAISDSRASNVSFTCPRAKTRHARVDINPSLSRSVWVDCWRRSWTPCTTKCRSVTSLLSWKSRGSRLANSIFLRPLPTVLPAPVTARIPAVIESGSISLLTLRMLDKRFVDGRSCPSSLSSSRNTFCRATAKARVKR